MIVNASEFSHLADALINQGARQAIKFLSPTQTIKATRRTYKRAARRKTDPVEILFTIGRPNYAERAIIKQFKKAGAAFPISRVILKFAPKKQKKAA